MFRNPGEQLDETEHDVSTAVGGNSNDDSDDDGGADGVRFTESSGEGPELGAWMSTKNKSFPSCFNLHSENENMEEGQSYSQLKQKRANLLRTRTARNSRNSVRGTSMSLAG